MGNYSDISMHNGNLINAGRYKTMKRIGANIDFIIFYFTVTGLFGYVFQYKGGRTGPAGPVWLDHFSNLQNMF